MHAAADSPGDRHSLEDAVDALLEKVCAHTGKGTAFQVVLATDETGAVLTVEDAGAGMSGTAAGRGSTRSGPTGLGLHIVRRTAERSGGTFAITTAERGGAQGRLTLGSARPL